MIAIHQGCSITGMRAWPSASAQLCITDPPYGDTALPWDSKVDGWITEVARILTPTASIWVFGSMRFLAPLFTEFAAHGFKYSQDIVWRKQNGTGFHNDRFRRVHEHAVLFYRGNWADVHHETQYTMDAKAKTVRRKSRAPHWNDVGGGHYTSEDGGPRLMVSVLDITNEHGRAIHPTQKPIELIRPMVRYSCPPGGVVLDPFAGSASVGIAAAMEGHDYIGWEKDPQHYADATARIYEFENPAQPELFPSVA